MTKNHEYKVGLNYESAVSIAGTKESEFPPTSDDLISYIVRSYSVSVFEY